MELFAGPCVVPGFRFAGVHAGIKNKAGARDLGLGVADAPASAAAVFTTNRVKAAPVVLAGERMRAGRLQAIAANSGCANCLTGRAGLALARASCQAVAAGLKIAPALVLPCSTGIIGHLYSLSAYRAGVERAVRALRPDAMGDFAEAIMTTDTRPKAVHCRFPLGRGAATVAGIAKGAGMIAPAMATMLAFIVTDAPAAPAELRSALGAALPGSFHAISVDGDMSTNDCVVLAASAAAARRPLQARARRLLDEAVACVARALAREIVRDGEGATKLVEIVVKGAASRADALRVARKVANSPLVKTAFYGCDPNVGRIAAAAGASGARLDPRRLAISLGGVKVAAHGALRLSALSAAATKMRAPEFAVEIDLGLGRGEARMLSCDLSAGYVRINAEYPT